jgi:hypothetical protein
VTCLLVLLNSRREPDGTGGRGIAEKEQSDGRAGEEAAAMWFAVKGAVLVMLASVRARPPAGRGQAPGVAGLAALRRRRRGRFVAPVSGYPIYIALALLSTSGRRSAPSLHAEPGFGATAVSGAKEASVFRFGV